MCALQSCMFAGFVIHGRYILNLLLLESSSYYRKNYKSALSQKHLFLHFLQHRPTSYIKMIKLKAQNMLKGAMFYVISVVGALSAGVNLPRSVADRLSTI
jgi:hypothetical protein